MVNNTMQPNKNINPNQPSPADRRARPNEAGHLHLDDFVKIYDPKNLEVFVEKRS